MSANENSLLYLFFVVAAVNLLWRVVRDSDWKNFLPYNFKSSWKLLLVICGCFFAVFGGLNVLKAGFLVGFVYFAASFLAGFILSELNLAPFSRSIVLLAASVALTLLAPPSDLQLALSSAIGGLCLWKLSSNIKRPELSTLLDFLPPFVWLSASMWWSVAHTGNASHLNLGMVLAVLTVSILMRWVQMPLLFEDPVYLKRIVISISAGLTVLIIFNKLLLATNLAQLAGVAGVGFLASFILASLDNVKSESAISDALTKLVLVGALTLLAGRLYGMEGLLLLAAASVVVAKSGLAQMAGIFFSCRVLQQSYTEQFNSNITGININHEYAGAALYFGLAAAVAASIALRNYKKGDLLAFALPLGGLLAAAGSSYLIHAEPTASLIVGTMVGGTIMAITGKEIFGSDFVQYQSAILCPAVLTGLCLILSPLLELGNTATTHDRLVAVGGLTVLLLIGSLVCFFIGGGFRKKPLAADAAATSSTG